MAIKKRKPASRAKKTTVRKTTARKTTARKTVRKVVAKRKTTAKKPVRKTAAKRTAVRKTSVRQAPMKITAIRDPFSKTNIMRCIADNTELTKKQVESVFMELDVLMQRHLKKGAAGQFTIPGLMKCEVKRKPAKKARKGINPFTGEEMMFKAKPARNVVKVRPLKKLKEMVS